MSALVSARELTKTYGAKRLRLFGPAQIVRAVDGVSFDIAPGEAFGLVGESGCGKTTVGRMIAGATAPTSGTVVIADQPFINPMSLARRASVQTVFQDTRGALNPRLSIGRQLTEPMQVHGEGDKDKRVARAAAALAEVGLPAEIMTRFPHEVSGGQRQRLVLARCLTLQPQLLVCDEAVSALDVSVQAHVVNLLADLKRKRGLACLFISHDLRVVDHLRERVGVMYLGRMVESGPRDVVLRRPSHPYTRALVASLPADRPGQERRRTRLPGEPPSPLNPPGGCAFHPRCAFVTDRCRSERPALRALGQGHQSACHNAEEIAA